MNIDFDQKIKDLQGNIIQPSVNEEPLDLRVVCVNSLMTDNPQKPTTGEQKFKNYELAKKVQYANGQCELTPEELTEIRKKIGELYATVVVGAAYELLQ